MDASVLAAIRTPKHQQVSLPLSRPQAFSFLQIGQVVLASDMSGGSYHETLGPSSSAPLASSTAKRCAGCPSISKTSS